MELRKVVPFFALLTAGDGGHVASELGHPALCSRCTGSDVVAYVLQQDIVRGRGGIDSLYQGGAVGIGGTHNAVLSSEEYLSSAARDLNNIEDGFYISPAFLDKLSIHVAKNFLDLPKIKVLLPPSFPNPKPSELI